MWTTNADGNPDRPNGMYAQYEMPLKHKFDYGITAGAGIELNTRVGHFMLDGRYYYGLSDLYGNSKKRGVLSFKQWDYRGEIYLFV